MEGKGNKTTPTLTTHAEQKSQIPRTKECTRYKNESADRQENWTHGDCTSKTRPFPHAFFDCIDASFSLYHCQSGARISTVNADSVEEKERKREMNALPRRV